MQKNIVILGIGCIGLCSIGLWLYLTHASDVHQTLPFGLEPVTLPTNSQIIATGGTSVSLATSSPAAAGVPGPRAIPAGTKEYSNADYHFSILYPKGVTALERTRASSKDPLFVVFQDPQTNQGFQIYAFSYPSPAITQARFNMDEPSGVLNSPQNVSVAGASGIMFLSHDSVIGTIREIWFIHQGILYEITTAQSLDQWMQSIMQTWQFN